jgi:hypothetical protein
MTGFKMFAKKTKDLRACNAEPLPLRLCGLSPIFKSTTAEFETHKLCAACSAGYVGNPLKWLTPRVAQSCDFDDYHPADFGALSRGVTGQIGGTSARSEGLLN